MVVTKGDIVLVDFPFTDLSQTKLRPAVVLWISSIGEDIAFCAITSQNVQNLSAEEFSIVSSEPEFQGTGLRVDSKVKVTRIATLNRQMVIRRLGKLGDKYLNTLNTKMIQAFQLR
jgi:mRNA interferase MazF